MILHWTRMSRDVWTFRHVKKLQWVFKLCPLELCIGGLLSLYSFKGHCCQRTLSHLSGNFNCVDVKLCQDLGLAQSILVFWFATDRPADTSQQSGHTKHTAMLELNLSRSVFWQQSIFVPPIEPNWFSKNPWKRWPFIEVTSIQNQNFVGFDRTMCSFSRKQPFRWRTSPSPDPADKVLTEIKSALNPTSLTPPPLILSF